MRWQEAVLALVGWHSPTRLRTIDNASNNTLHTAAMHATCTRDNKKKQGRRGDDEWRVEWLGRAWHQRCRHREHAHSSHAPLAGSRSVSTHSDFRSRLHVAAVMTRQRIMHSAILLGEGVAMAGRLSQPSSSHPPSQTLALHLPRRTNNRRHPPSRRQQSRLP